MNAAQQIQTVRRGAFLRAAIAAGICAAVALALLLTGCERDASQPAACLDNRFVCSTVITCADRRPSIAADGCATQTFRGGYGWTVIWREGDQIHERTVPGAGCTMNYDCVRPSDDVAK